MSLVDKLSYEVGKEELSLFSVPPTQVAIVNSYRNVFYPKNKIDRNGPVLFEVPPNPNFIDVSSNTLYVKFKITKQDGSDLAAADNDAAAAVNYILNTLWSQVRLYANSKLLWDSHNTYAYKSMVETILGYSRAEKGSYLTSAFYYEDGPEDLDVRTEGHRVRTAFTNGSEEIEVCGSLHVDPFSQQRYWPPFLGFSLELFRNNDDFLLQNFTLASPPKLQLIDARLTFRVVEPAPSLKIAFEKHLMKSSGAKYPIRRSEIKIIHLESGRDDLPNTQLLTGILPRRVVVFMVNSSAFHGDVSLNPFNFQHFGVNYLQLSAGGHFYPPKPLEPDFSTENFNNAYHAMNECMKTDSGMPCGLTRAQFKKGYSLFAFDLSADSSGSQMHFNPLNTGTLELALRFNFPLANPIKVMCYLEFDSVLTVDKQRNFYLDYSV